MGYLSASEHRSGIRRLTGFFVIIALSLTTAISQGEDAFSALISDYKKYELPVPSDHAQMSIVKWSTGTSNGVPQYRRILALVQSDKQTDTTFFWVGCHKELLPTSVDVTVTEPNVASLAKTEPMDAFDQRTGFDSYPDVALAVHCSMRGWDELAAALRKRAGTAPQGRSNFPRKRIVSDQSALALLAWSYWCDKFCLEKGDRSPIVEHLARLRDGPHGLDSKYYHNIVADMRRTLVPSESPPDSVENTIDSLIDLGNKGGWRGRGLGSLPSVAWYESYRELEKLGLEAVPALLKHTHDFRLTRCIGRDRGIWHLRIADVVRELLNGLVQEEFAYDVLIREGRGKCVDRAHVLHWWTSTQKVQARDYLLANALSTDADGTVRTHKAVLRALGRSYPGDLVKLVDENLDRVPYPVDLFNALGVSKATGEAKSAIFLRAAKSDNSWARSAALEELLTMKHPRAAALMVDELGKIPRTPKVPYWESTAARFAQAACYTDDADVWAALTANAKRVDIGQRLEMIQAIGARSGRKDDLVIGFLSAFLNDQESRKIDFKATLGAVDESADAINRAPQSLYFGPSAGFTFERLSVRNYAALQLASKLGLPSSADPRWKESDWETLRGEVREAIARRK